MTENHGYQVLHCHTKLSDGTMSHREVLDKCAEKGISVVAFTDHDVVMPEEVVTDLKSLNHQVKFISGIEVSATNVKEIEGNISLFHIVGLFVDYKNEVLINHCIRAKEKRLERLNRIVANLKNVGFSITVEEILKFVTEGTVGRPHIARAVIEKEENRKIIAETLGRLKAEAGKDPSFKEAYESAKDNDDYRLMFDLYLRSGAFIPDVYVPYLEHVTMDEAVTLIRDAEGIAILAHPSYLRDKIGVSLVEQFVKEGRIDGIETIYAMSPDGITGDDFLADMEVFKSLVKKYNIVAGGGGDHHTPMDFERIMVPANIARMEESKTFLQNIFAKWPELEKEASLS